MENLEFIAEKDYGYFQTVARYQAKRYKETGNSVQDAHNLFNVLFLSFATGFFLSAKTVRSVAAFFVAVGPSVGFVSSFKWVSECDFNLKNN